jgi:2-succinyl-5-enolpyruvyl-6-hydroxy-3-cyclohexene-1-carboxylate synthase
MSAPDIPPTPGPSDVQATFCATLVDEWVRAGITHAVVSPGSRSTPMALALVSDGRLRVSVVLDERSAAFRALGLGRATGRPAILLCTSGTAAVEYHAAVVEADLDRVPMLVCTADRPAELLGIGAPQTVNQHGLFGGSVRWSGELGVPDPANRNAWRSFGARAVGEAEGSGRGPGPVHVNLPFREPLLGTVGDLPAGRADGAPWHRVIRGSAVPVASGRLEAVKAMVHGRRGVIVAGADAVSDAAGAAVVHRLAAALGWPVIADPRSGLRTKASPVVAAADAILRSPTAGAALKPEVILRLGSPWASKVLGQWLAATGADDILVDPFGAWLDPHRMASLVIAAEPVELASGLLDLRVAGARPAWTSRWRSVAAAADAVVADALDRDEDGDGEGNADAISEPWIARMLVQSLPEGSRLVASSSMPVRDIEWFSPPVIGVEVLVNRGANGIDGVVSTVLGAGSVGDGRVTVGLLGDLAFLHDAGALAGAEGVDATIVVIDNGGGGIFEFLPQASALERGQFEQLFGTRQPVDVAAVARGYGLDVTEVEDHAGFRVALEKASSASRTRTCRVVVVRTDRQANVTVHDALNAAIGAAVEAVLPR